MRMMMIALVSLIGLAPAAQAASNSDWVARVKRISGAAFVEQDGEKSPLKVGDRLPAEAVVITGPKSGAGLTFRDNTRVSLGANGRIALSRYAFEPGRGSAEPELETNLQSGAAAFVSGRVTKRKPGAMRVRTPAALLGVRGTTFVAITETPLDQ